MEEYSDIELQKNGNWPSPEVEQLEREKSMNCALFDRVYVGRIRGGWYFVGCTNFIGCKL